MQVINPEVGHAVAHPGSPRHFMARQPFTSRTKFVLDFAASCGQVVAVTNILRSYAAVQAVHATANGAVAVAHYQDNASYFFDAPACISGATIRWRLTIDGIREAVDVVTF